MKFARKECVTLALVLAFANCSENEDWAPATPDGPDDPVTWRVGGSADKNYWLEGEYLVHDSKIGDGIPIVIVGEGFNHDELRKGGYWEQIGKVMGSQFLKNEVTRDLRPYYDVYILMSESAMSNTGVANNENLGQGKSRFEKDNFGMADDAIREYLPLGDRFDTRRMIYVCNGAIGGWAYLGYLGCFSTETDWPQVDGEVNTVDLTKEPSTYWMMHEFAGHAFGNLADEYYWSEVEPGDWNHSNFDFINRHATDGNSALWATENPGHAAPWAPFIGLEGYEMTGYFGSGGNLHCEADSAMLSAYCFRYNAMSRYSIWAGTMVKAGVNPMEYYLDIVDYDGTKTNAFPTSRGLSEFMAYDVVNYDATGEAITGEVTVSRDRTVLTADAAISGGSVVIYTWQRGDAASGPWSSIIGASGLTKDSVITDDGNVYYIQAEDTGKYLRVRTSRTGLRGYVDSVPLGPVEAYPALTGSVTITGILTTGSAIGVDTSGLSGGTSSADDLVYQWHRGFENDPQTFFVAQKKVEDDSGSHYECETGPTLVLKNSGDDWPTNDAGAYLRVLVRRKGYTGFVKSAIVSIP